MKSLLFLICLMFSFLSFTLAKPANSVKEKQKSIPQVTKFTQNQMLFRAFERFEFESPTDYFYGYIVKEKKSKYFIPKAGKPCKIPIPLQIRNKNNI